LDRERGLVVQEPVVPALALEDELAAEEDRARELLGELEAELLDGLDRLGAQLHAAGGAEAARPRPLDVALEALLGVALERLDLARSLEDAAVGDRRRDEDEVPEVPREHALDRQHLVQA